MKTTVQQITELEITGNIIPMQWFKRITFKAEGKKGKVRPHLLAINILADIVYWYKAKETRDERSGQVRKYEKKFAGHKLQRSYGQLANTFGVSKEQARIACKVLENHGLITMELRNMNAGERKLINVLFLEPVPAKIHEYTYDKISGVPQNFWGGYGEISMEVSPKISGEGMEKFPDTYTENTSTKISNTKNSIHKETGSDISTSDKETKTPIQKSKDVPLNAKISLSEEILNGIPSQYTSEHSEPPQRPNSYYVGIYVNRYKAEHDNEAPYRLDTFALEDLWWQLDYSEEKFDRLVRNYRSDKFWKDKKITVPFLLKYKSISADWNREPVRMQPEEIHELRRTVRVIDGSQYAGMEAPF